MKKCAKCKTDKSALCFGPMPAKKDDLDYWCKDCRSEYQKNWRTNNPGKAADKNRRAYLKHQNERLDRQRKYYALNRTEIIKKQAEKDKNKAAIDPGFRLLRIVRNRIRFALNGRHKSFRTKNLLGCSIVFFRGFIQAQFQSGMTWDNCGKYWELDHVIPCSHFDLSDPEQQKVCFSWVNHQPLTKFENRSKRDFFVG